MTSDDHKRGSSKEHTNIPFIFLVICCLLSVGLVWQVLLHIPFTYGLLAPLRELEGIPVDQQYLERMMENAENL
ncbi:hypothetical protein [Paenibacillus massiliensis]|uniref:hypothetical protein n=1 Tax=Paenibacillus massiliensis TaxID=225917 RepID=UPI00037D2F9E|nr:hypothetical protein [Paenibacillus massiliensis]